MGKLTIDLADLQELLTRERKRERKTPPLPSVNDSVVIHLASLLKQEKQAQVIKPHTLAFVCSLASLNTTNIKSSRYELAKGNLLSRA